MPWSSWEGGEVDSGVGAGGSGGGKWIGRGGAEKSTASTSKKTPQAAVGIDWNSAMSKINSQTVQEDDRNSNSSGISIMSNILGLGSLDSDLLSLGDLTPSGSPLLGVDAPFDDVGEGEGEGK